LADTLTSLQKTMFSAEELREIDCHATDGGLNIWRVSSSIEGTSS
jgi:L-glyceraldehyde 3-phosphate reductase